MTQENPYESTSEPADSDPSTAAPISAEHAAYNVVSDTIIGVNVRKGDNIFQAVFILVSILVVSALGAIISALYGGGEIPPLGGAVIGAFAGLVFGLLASGVCLMFYRGVRHLRGKHE